MNSNRKDSYLVKLDQRERTRAERERARAKWLPHWRTRRHRRALALVTVAGNLILIVGALIDADRFLWLWAALQLSGLLLWCTGLLLLRILTGKISSGFPSTLLDEREREWRHRVTYIGFKVFAYLMLGALFYTAAIARQPNAGHRAVYMISALLLVGLSTPSIVVGWTLPDDDPQDFTEEGDQPDEKPAPARPDPL